MIRTICQNFVLKFEVFFYGSMAVFFSYWNRFQSKSAIGDNNFLFYESFSQLHCFLSSIHSMALLHIFGELAILLCANSIESDCTKWSTVSCVLHTNAIIVFHNWSCFTWNFSIALAFFSSSLSLSLLNGWNLLSKNGCFIWLYAK